MLCNVTEHPQAEWVVQQLRILSLQHDRLPRFILHDRDGKFSEEFDAFARASGSKIIKLPARSPNLNAYAERWRSEERRVGKECRSRRGPGRDKKNGIKTMWDMIARIAEENRQRPHR